MKKDIKIGILGFLLVLVLYILGIYISGLVIERGSTLAFWYVAGIVLSGFGAVFAILLSKNK